MEHDSWATQHYNNIVVTWWRQRGWQAVYDPSCLQQPYHETHWDIRYPAVAWNDRTVVIMHCQDFLTIDDQGCSELRHIEKHFGEHAHRVVVLHWNYDLGSVYHGPVNLVHFPTHSYQLLQNLANPPYQNWRQALQGPRTLRWQCLNGIPRPHRRLVHGWLRDKPGGIVSLESFDPLYRDAYDDVYDWNLGYDLNEQNFQTLSWLYSSAEINIVTETRYDLSPGIISEKTLFALLAQQVPIVIGYKGIVDHCRKLGFDMFDDIVDTSYDTCDNSDRWLRALELNQDLLLGSRNLPDLTERLLHQREWVSRIWPQIMIQNYHDRCAEILENLTTA